MNNLISLSNDYNTIGQPKSVVMSKEEKFDKFVFYACVIDYLFLPYVWFVSIPYTMPLLFYWIVRRNNILKKTKEYKMFLLMITLMGISTIFSFIYAPIYIYKNIVYLIFFTTMFLTYFMFSYYINRYPFNIKHFLIFFILFNIVLVIFFNIDKSFYHSIKLIFNQRSGIFINDNLYEKFVGYRYAFIWMDPNNIAYVLNAIVLYLWCNEKTSFFVKVFSFVSLLYILIACMSNGGFLSLGIIVGSYILIEVLHLLKGKYKIRVQIKPLNLFLFIITVCALVYVIPQIPKYLETGIAHESLDRIRNNSGDSRFEMWQYTIKNVNFLEYIFTGRGGVTLVNDTIYNPHNGHFIWILGYGLIAYYIFMYLIFRKRSVTSLKKYIWILPILFGFTINVMIGEIKLMGIVMLLVACSTSPKYLNRKT